MEGNGPKAGRGRCAGEGGERHRFRAKAGQQKSGVASPQVLRSEDLHSWQDGSEKTYILIGG